MVLRQSIRASRICRRSRPQVYARTRGDALAYVVDGTAMDASVDAVSEREVAARAAGHALRAPSA